MHALETEDKRQSPILATKLAIPTPRAPRVLRPRLTDRLEAAESRLALVVAPAGWGKSSLISEWCAQTENGTRSVAWVALDAGDNDPARFLLYLCAACDTVQPGLGEVARGMVQSSQPPPPEVVLTALLNEVAALPRPLTLILDDYHTIEAQAIHDSLAFLLNHAPPTLRMLLSTRFDPPLPLSRLRVRGQLMELRAQDLRFTSQEAAAFLNEAMGLSLGADAIARLEARTEGWIAGLQLVAISLQGRANPAEFIASFTGSNRYIVDYLFDEVLARQSEQTRAFLMETSVLNRLCGPLCDAVTGRPGGQALLEKLDAANLFVIALDDERRWYRYHQLFVDVLRAALEQEKSGLAGELNRRAAVWYDAQGMGEDAVDHALAGNHLELAAQYIERYGDAMWKRGEQRTMEQWLRALPPKVVLSRPKLCVSQGCVYLFNSQADALGRLLDACLPQVLSEDPQERDVQGQLLALDGYDLARRQGDYTRALEMLQKASGCFLPENAVWRGITMYHLGVLHFEDDNLDATREAFIETSRLARSGDDLITALVSTCCLGEVQEEQGELQQAARLYQGALDYASQRKVGPFPHLRWVYADLGRLHYQWNDLPTAQTVLQEGLECKLPGPVNPCYLELLKVKKALGDAEGVAALLEQIKAFPTQFGIYDLADIVTALQVWVQPERKEETAAWLERCETRTEERWPHTFPYLPYRETETLIWARIRLAQGQSERVVARLEPLLESLIRQGRDGTAVEFRTLLATAYEMLHKTDKALTILKPALLLAEKEGYMRSFLDVGPLLVPVLTQAAAQGIAMNHAAKLLNVFRESGMVRGARREEAVSPLADPLSERELEVLRLVAAGLSNPEIADRLFLSVGTVKRHVFNIYGKLDVTGRVNAVARARALGLL